MLILPINTPAITARHVPGFTNLGATEALFRKTRLLIENTETAARLPATLKIIDTLFESTAHLIGAKSKDYSAVKKARIDISSILSKTAAGLNRFLEVIN